MQNQKPERESVTLQPSGWGNMFCERISKSESGFGKNLAKVWNSQVNMMMIVLKDLMELWLGSWPSSWHCSNPDLYLQYDCSNPALSKNSADIFNIGSLSVSLVSIQAEEEWTWRTERRLEKEMEKEMENEKEIGEGKDKDLLVWDRSCNFYVVACLWH